MCNYYSRHRPPRNLQAAWHFPEETNLQPRYVIRPTTIESVVAIGGKDGGRHLTPMRWGLIPSWAKDLKTGLTMFNARAETIAEKPSFKGPLTKGRRCLVPVDGFFEFSGEKGAKQPHYIKPKDDRPMAFTGLWESWSGPKHPGADADMTAHGPILSYTFATCAPNAVVAPIHDRMPVLLTEPAQWDLWLDPKAELEPLLALLNPAPDDLLEAFMVTRDLLKIKDPGAEVLKKVG